MKLKPGERSVLETECSRLMLEGAALRNYLLNDSTMEFDTIEEYKQAYGNNWETIYVADRKEASKTFSVNGGISGELLIEQARKCQDQSIVVLQAFEQAIPATQRKHVQEHSTAKR